MKKLVVIAILLIIAALASGQGRYPFHVTNVATPDSREDIMYLFENNNDNEIGGDGFVNTGMTYETSGNPPEGTYLGRALDGGTDYFQIPTSYTDFFPTSFTVMFWLYVDYSSSNVRIINCGTAYSSGFNVRYNSTGNDLDVFTNSTEINANNFGTAIGAWNHIAISYESTTGYVNIFVNGVHRTTNGSGVSGITLTNPWYMLNGAAARIDDFRVFPELLNVSEVLSIVNNPGVLLNDI